MLPRLVALLLCSVAIESQTTHGLVAGRVTDANTLRPIAGARILLQNSLNLRIDNIQTNPSGYYSAISLPPGTFRLRAEAAGYQSIEIQELVVRVAGRLELNIRLRAAGDVWEKGQYRNLEAPGAGSIVTFFGPDLDEVRPRRIVTGTGIPGILETSVSTVVQASEIERLPLNGRDVYALLVAQPGVTATTDSTLGLGFSVNGQRPSSSNFLLDGVENNNSLVTGPASVTPPELIEEYRISANNFSAEFGRTAGFLANAITRGGGASWHGLGYFNFQNDVLNANTFQRNANNLARSPFKGLQGGGRAGGPIRANRWYVSAGLDLLRNRGFDNETTVLLPSASLLSLTHPASLAHQLLQQYPAAVVPDTEEPRGSVTVRPPVGLNRGISFARLDGIFGRHRLSSRYSAYILENPSYTWSPYPDFVSGLDHGVHSAMARLDSTIGSRAANEFRFGWSRSNLGWDRAHPEIPFLNEASGTLLPGSPALYSYRNRTSTYEIGDSVTLVRGNHIPKFGGGIFHFRPGGSFSPAQQGMFVFADLLDFTIDDPTLIQAPLDRNRLPAFELFQPDRQWSRNQFYLFGQDVWRITDRLVLNYGLRYESFGAPRTSGDTLLELGPGQSFDERLRNAYFQTVSDQTLWSPDRNDFQGRLGISFSPRAGGNLVLRAGYGIFQDYPFDNLWQTVRNNSLVMPNLLRLGPGGYNYLTPLDQQLAQFEGQPIAIGFPSSTAIDPNLRNGYSQTFFAGGQWRVRRSVFAELNMTGTLGRKLITSDVVNREQAVNSSLPEVTWRSSQGSSRYFGLQALARWTPPYGLLQAAYTWSHAIDNQSDPLAGDYFDLRQTRPGSAGTSTRARFDLAQDSSGDLGNSDFDQRHSLVFYSIWNWKGFSFSQLSALRSGSPYTVLDGYRRANVIGNAAVDEEAPGGRRLLDAAAFETPAPGQPSNIGRNAFRGPGYISFDASIARTFRLTESKGFTIRADAYNLFNHANLDNPQWLLSTEDFGIAQYGRRSRSTGFPALTPLIETPRTLQLMLRFEF